MVETTKRNARGIERRRVILEAAVNVVAGGGSSALTHRAAARESQVSLASVTYHFPSSDDLRRATLAFAAAEIGSEFEASLVCDEGHAAVIGSLAERWRSIGLAHRASFATLFSLLVEALHDPDLRPDAEALVEVPTRVLTAQGIPRAVADALVGSLVGLALIALARNHPDDSLAQFDASVATTLDAFEAQHREKSSEGSPEVLA